MPNFWHEFWWRFFHHKKVKTKIKTVDVVITIRDKQHHDSAYARFQIKEGSHGSHH